MTHVAAALIERDGKFLIAQRPGHKARGHLWEFVGGKLEPGETPQQALRRECREEMDINVTVGELFMELVHEYPDLTVRLSVFSATTEDEPRLLEHEDARWITPAEIGNYEFCPADKDILAKIRKERE